MFSRYNRAKIAQIDNLLYYCWEKFHFFHIKCSKKRANGAVYAILSECVRGGTSKIFRTRCEKY